MSGNLGISDRAMCAILARASEAARLCPLRILKAAGCRLGEPTAQAVLRCLLASRTLKVVDLAWNAFGAKGTNHFCRLTSSALVWPRSGHHEGLQHVAPSQLLSTLAHLGGYGSCGLHFTATARGAASCCGFRPY